MSLSGTQRTEVDLELGGSTDEDERSSEEGVKLLPPMKKGPSAKKISVNDIPEVSLYDNSASNQSIVDRGKITLAGTKIFERKTHFSLCKHKLAAIHLGTRHFWWFKLPISIITLVSGILAFLATTEPFKGEDKNDGMILNCTVGSLAFVLAFLQTLASHFKLDARAEMHKGTEVDLTDLREYLDVAVDRAKILDSHGVVQTGVFKDEDGDGIDDAVQNALDSYQSRYSQCLTGCKSTVPLRINDAFDNLESRLQLKFSLQSRRMSMHKKYGDTDYESTIYFNACDLLAAKFSGGCGWPMLLPNPIWAVNETMKELDEVLPPDIQISIGTKRVS